MDDLQGNFRYLDEHELKYLRNPPTTKFLSSSINIMRGLFPELTWEQALLRTHICFLSALRAEAREKANAGAHRD
jgi:hypothetical protein